MTFKKILSLMAVTVIAAMLMTGCGLFGGENGTGTGISDIEQVFAPDDVPDAPPDTPMPTKTPVVYEIATPKPTRSPEEEKARQEALDELDRKSKEEREVLQAEVDRMMAEANGEKVPSPTPVKKKSGKDSKDTKTSNTKTGKDEKSAETPAPTATPTSIPTATPTPVPKDNVPKDDGGVSDW